MLSLGGKGDSSAACLHLNTELPGMCLYLPDGHLIKDAGRLHSHEPLPHHRISGPDDPINVFNFELPIREYFSDIIVRSFDKVLSEIQKSTHKCVAAKIKAPALLVDCHERYIQN